MANKPCPSERLAECREITAAQNVHIETLVKGQRDLWESVSHIRESAQRIEVSTSCVPKLLDEIRSVKQRVAVIETQTAVQEGLRAQSKRFFAFLFAVAGAIGGFVGWLSDILFDWFKIGP